MIHALLQNWQTAFRETLESALAAALAWWIGLLVFGGEHTPLFAAVTAVVCLAPGLPSHSKQAIGLLVGVIAGIVVGEVTLAVAGSSHPAVLGAAVFIAMMAALAFKVQPIVGIQAGVSTVIVLVEGQDVDSFRRIIDALIGGVVALGFSQVLLTPDPFKILREEGGKMAGAARDLHECLRSDGSCEDIRKHLRDLDAASMALEEQLEYVERIATRTLRGRWYRKPIGIRVSQWRECKQRLRLSLEDVAHGRLASEGEKDNGTKLDEADRWLDAGQALSKGDDRRYREVEELEDGE